MNRLTDAQLARQDFVDGAIYDLVCRLDSSGHHLPWDIEMIAEIRDLIHSWLLRKCCDMDAMKFYPYLPSDGND